MRSWKFYCRESAEPFRYRACAVRPASGPASARLHPNPLEGSGRCRRRDEVDERFGGIRFLCPGNDAAGKDGELLDLRRQRADVIDAGEVGELAHLLEADLGLPVGDDAADENPGRRLLELVLDLV